jgi:hypothetical protein
MLNEIIEATIAHCLVTPSERRGSTKDGWVYFARRIEGGPVKIGFSRTPSSRAANLGWEHETHIRILRAVPGTMRDEKTAHALFDALRERGEWFTAAPELLAFVDGLPLVAWP